MKRSTLTKIKVWDFVAIAENGDEYPLEAYGISFLEAVKSFYLEDEKNYYLMLRAEDYYEGIIYKDFKLIAENQIKIKTSGEYHFLVRKISEIQQ